MLPANESTSLRLPSFPPILRYDGWSVPWYRFLLDFMYMLGIRNWEYSEREPFGIKNTDLRRRVREKFRAHELSEKWVPPYQKASIWGGFYIEIWRNGRDSNPRPSA